MAANANLHKAKNAKNDEFYTQLTDVSKELMHYKQHFKDKVVFCNCDDPTWSAFWKYFHLNFLALGLKKLISTHYDKTELTYKMEYTGGDDNDIEVGVKTPLEGNGDFRNQECLDLLDEADIVVTNPPFSLFREYVACLVEHDKKFIILGNMNAITCKEIFNFMRANELWLGCMAGSKTYRVPDDYDGKCFIEDGIKYVKMGNTEWFTNLDIQKRHEKLILWKHYTPEEYPKYDNYDAINVDKIADIPVDYNGIMGVPISYLDKHNPDEFEILGVTRGYAGDFAEWAVPEAYPIKKYINCVQHRRNGTNSKNGMANTRATILIDKKPSDKDYYTADNADGMMEIVYARILIRKKVDA